MKSGAERDIQDEAASNVDTRTEKAIRDADLIVVMDQGQIVEQGTHEGLLARKGKYYQLYMTQYAGFAT